MSGPLQRYLSDDHQRIDALLASSLVGESIDLPRYEEFRARMLRHIGMEEKILLPTARKIRGGEPLPIAEQLRFDHAALAALLVPTPTKAIVDQLRELLAVHNLLEEGEGGLYEICEQLTAGDAQRITERLAATPEVPLAPHFDGPRAFEAIERLLAAARRRRE